MLLVAVRNVKKSSSTADAQVSLLMSEAL